MAAIEDGNVSLQRPRDADGEQTEALHSPRPKLVDGQEHSARLQASKRKSDAKPNETSVEHEASSSHPHVGIKSGPLDQLLQDASGTIQQIHDSADSIPPGFGNQASDRLQDSDAKQQQRSSGKAQANQLNPAEVMHQPQHAADKEKPPTMEKQSRSIRPDQGRRDHCADSRGSPSAQKQPTSRGSKRDRSEHCEIAEHSRRYHENEPPAKRTHMDDKQSRDRPNQHSNHDRHAKHPHAPDRKPAVDSSERYRDRHRQNGRYDSDQQHKDSLRIRSRHDSHNGLEQRMHSKHSASGHERHKQDNLKSNTRSDRSSDDRVSNRRQSESAHQHHHDSSKALTGQGSGSTSKGPGFKQVKTATASQPPEQSLRDDDLQPGSQPPVPKQPDSHLAAATTSTALDQQPVASELTAGSSTDVKSDHAGKAGRAEPGNKLRETQPATNEPIRPSSIDSGANQPELQSASQSCQDVTKPLDQSSNRSLLPKPGSANANSDWKAAEPTATATDATGPAIGLGDESKRHGKPTNQTLESSRLPAADPGSSHSNPRAHHGDSSPRKAVWEQPNKRHKAMEHASRMLKGAPSAHERDNIRSAEASLQKSEAGKAAEGVPNRNLKQRASNAASPSSRAHRKSKPKLSFDEEDPDVNEKASSSFSLAASTARKFQTEREITPLNPLSQALAPTFRSNFSSAPSQDHESRRFPSKSLGRLHFGVATILGAKPTMEDRHVVIPSYSPIGPSGQPLQDGIPRSFVAVYDGHNGQRAAEVASHRLHLLLARDPALGKCTGEGAAASAFQEEAAMAAAFKKAFTDMDDEILTGSRRDGLRDGTTAVAVLRLGDALYTAHAGDSRAVLCQKGRALRLTDDHKPDNPAERRRVEAAGGKVEMQGVWRVISGGGPDRPRSGLAVSRGLGDIDHKEPKRLVSCEPDVSRRKLLPGDAFIIVASDGLWDALTDQSAVDIAARSLASSRQSGMQSSAAALDAQAKVAANELIRAAVPMSGDNITVIIVLFAWG